LSWTFLAFVWVLILVAPAFSQTIFDVSPQSQTDYLPGTFVVLAHPGGNNYYANYNDDYFGQQSGYVYAAVLDTGSSGSVISALEAQGRGLSMTTDTYIDVGIGGTESFNVSAPTTVKLATVDSGAVVVSPGGLSVTEHVDMFSPFGTDYKLQVRGSDPIIQDGASKVAINTLGTPLLNQYVMHVNSGLGAQVFPYSLDSLGTAPVNFVPTELVAKSSLPRDLHAGSSELVLVPKDTTKSVLHVPLVYKDFIDYKLNPNPAPSVSTNPTIPGVTISLGAGTATSDWLFDSGASVTMMGRDLATSLGIDVSQPGITELPVLGIGGAMPMFQGYEIDQLVLSATNGDKVTFHDVVVFVPGKDDLPADLPGIFGMNLINNSFSGLSGDPFFGIEELDPVSSNFSDWYVVPAAVPEPSSFVLLAIGVSILLLRRMRTRRLI